MTTSIKNKIVTDKKVTRRATANYIAEALLAGYTINIRID